MNLVDRIFYIYLFLKYRNKMLYTYVGIRTLVGTGARERDVLVASFVDHEAAYCTYREDDDKGFLRDS